MIKMSSMRFFRVLNLSCLLEGVFQWTKIRIMRNSKWPPFCFIKFYFYLHLDLTQVVLGPELVFVHPHYSTILIRGLLWMILTMLPEKKWGAIWISAILQNCRNENLNLDNISSYNLHRIILLVSTPMFSWLKNRMKPPLIKRLGHSYIAKAKKIQDGSQKKLLYDRIAMSILKNKFYLLPFHTNNKNVIVIRTGMVIQVRFVSVIFYFLQLSSRNTCW